MSNPKSPKLDFTEDHINYIFNYLNEMYSDRLNTLEKLVTRNSESLHSLKQDLDNLNNSLSSLSFLNNYKINTANSLSSNFSDFFHNFITINNNNPNQNLKTQSKSVENGLKTPTNLKPALKSIKTTPKAEKKPESNTSKLKETPKPLKKEGFKLVSPKVKKQEPTEKEKVPTHKKSESTANAKNFSSLKTPLITPTSQSNQNRQKTPIQKHPPTKVIRKPSVDSNHEKDKKKETNNNGNNTKIQKEILDFKKLLVKKPNKVPNSARNNTSQNESKNHGKLDTSRSVSKDKSYQKATRSSVSKRRPSKETSPNQTVNYSSLIKSVNEFLDFPEMEAKPGEKNKISVSNSKKDAAKINKDAKSPKNIKKTDIQKKDINSPKFSEEKNNSNYENNEIKVENGNSIIKGLEKHCDNINKLYEEVLNVPSGKDMESSSKNDETLTKNTSLAKIVEKRDSALDMESDEKKEYFSPQHLIKQDNYKVKVLSYQENVFRGEKKDEEEAKKREKNDDDAINQLKIQKKESNGVLDDEESNISREITDFDNNNNNKVQTAKNDDVEDDFLEKEREIMQPEEKNEKNHLDDHAFKKESIHEDNEDSYLVDKEKNDIEQELDEDDKNNKKPNLISKIEDEDEKKNSLKAEAEEDLNLNETHENHNIKETSEIPHEKKEEPSEANIDSQVLNKEDDNDGLLDEENKEHDHSREVKTGDNENLPSEGMEDDDVL